MQGVGYRGFSRQSVVWAEVSAVAVAFYLLSPVLRVFYTLIPYILCPVLK